MTDVRYTEITSEEDGQRLDNYLIRVLKGVPKSHIYRIIRGGEVRINKKRVKVSTRLSTGDCVRIPPVRTAVEKQAHVSQDFGAYLQTCILHEDEGLLVINKPAGIAVHGGSGLSLGLVEALRAIRTDLPYLELVHRLDKETSGCLLLAKKRRVLREIQALLAARTIQKTYWAILSNHWDGKKTVEIDAPLEKNTLQSGERMVRVNQREGKASQTLMTLLENYQHACWVEIKPRTGRTHQIRVHGAYIGHPVVGDSKYGIASALTEIDQPLHRLYLHARSIQFTLDGKKHAFQAELDDKFTQALKQYRVKG